VKSIRVQFKIQIELKLEKSVFVKSAILANFYFAPEGFQCATKVIFIPKNLKHSDDQVIQFIALKQN